MNPKISIIIPAFNSEDTLERCVESAKNQTYKNLEIIIIDDGSTDQTSELGKNLEKTDERVKYIFQENRGLPSARNRGKKLATGEYLFFLDSDDTIDLNLIENLIKNQKEETLVGSNIKNIFPEKSLIGNRDGEFEKDAFLEEIFEDKKPSFVCGYLFDVKKCERIFFDEKTRYYEDILFLVRYLNSDVEHISLISDIFYNYYQNLSSITLSSSNIIEKLSDIRRATEKTNEETNNKFAEKNNNREIGLFEAILQRADDNTLKRTLDKFTLPKYTGRSKRLKLFSSLYAKKNINGLKKYYHLRKIGKKLVMKIQMR